MSTQQALQGGYIARIELENFMCHRKFKIDLHNEMNIIVGRNGSGKSAILTALIVGLGGGARSTARGNSFRDLIRHGAQDAFIIITVCNPAPLAPSMAKYGEKFTIQRRIGHKTNSWSIRNANSRLIISTSKSDVAHICHSLGFQPDNILVMLNQENAKQFLVGATPRAKYDQLDKALAISSQYDTIRELEEAFGTFKKQYEVQIQRKTVLDAERANQEAWISKAEAEQNAADIAAEYEAVLAWRKVQSAESIHDAANEKHKAAVETLKEIARQYAEAQDNPTGQSDVLALTDRVDALRREAESYESRAEEAEVAAQQLETNVKSLKAAKKEAEEKWAASKRALNEMQVAKPAENDTTDLRRQLEVAREQLPHVTTKLGADRDALERLQSSLDEAEDEEKLARSNLEQARRALKSTEDDLRNAKAGAAQDPLNGFGTNGYSFRALNKAIDNYKGWRHKPVGPLLAHVRAAPDCSRAAVSWAELQLSRHAGMYWVRTLEDQRVLRGFPEWNKCRSVGAILWTPELFSYKKPQPSQPDAKTFFQAVRIEDPHIERLLVDHARVEDMLFCDTSESATRELDSQSVSSTFFTDSSSGWRKLSRRGRTYDSQFINKRPDQVKLQVAADSIDKIRETYQQRISEESEQVKHLEQRLARAKEKVQSYKRDIASRTREIEGQDRDLTRLQSDIDSKTKQIAAAEKQPEEEQNEYLIGDLQKQCRRNEIAYRNLDPQIQNAEKPVILRRGEVTDFRLERDQLLRQAAEVDKQIVQERQRQHTMARERETLAQKRDTAQWQVQTLQREIDDRSTQLMAVHAEALEKHGGRPDLSKYTKSDGEMSRAIQDIQAKAGQLEQLATELEERVQKRDRLTAEISAYEATSDRKARRVREYSSHMKSRKSSMKGSLNTILGRIAKDYKAFIAERGFTGQLEVNPNERKLVASANPSAGASDRSASTLSGGEKSYTQISLLLAVWNNINTGLVAMDEYDVFMDEQFRAASMEALVRTITGKPAQGILITPQGLPRAVYEKYKDSDMFKVHNLEAPRP